jgi:hypothetical protein
MMKAINVRSEWDINDFCSKIQVERT